MIRSSMPTTTSIPGRSDTANAANFPGYTKMDCSGFQIWTHEPGKLLLECWRSASIISRLNRGTGNMSDG